MSVNIQQEKHQIAKDKKRIEKARKAQDKIEKNGYWELVTGDFREYYKFVPYDKTNKRTIRSKEKVSSKKG